MKALMPDNVIPSQKDSLVYLAKGALSSSTPSPLQVSRYECHSMGYLTALRFALGSRRQGQQQRQSTEGDLQSPHRIHQ
ncbi:hypothetical protein EYF80_022501 [Liparis tanakae]|uniref:Uncharacterized protein n=1 Tax=Liparis tanakae TaxID=230148 RepID=A0A4Z2HR46_9TELE|nr:hypothetical protein EYF80_022501 [Liparis tanakae]